MKTVHRIVGSLVVLLLLVACDAKGPYHVPLTKEPYLRWEAPGRFGAISGRRNVYWLDDDRVLYVGTDEDDSTYARSTLRIWTLSTGRVEVLGPSGGGLCYFRGYIRYDESNNTRPVVVREGQLGSPLALVPDHVARHTELTEKGYRVHPITCRYYQSRDLAPGENCKVPLLPGDGYLETQGGRCAESILRRIRSLRLAPVTDRAAIDELARIEESLGRQPIRYVRGGEPVSLPIEANELKYSDDNYQYVEWKKRYQLLQWAGKGQFNVGEWPKDQDFVAYLLSPSGSLEQASVPVAAHFLKRPDDVALTRGGLVAMSPGMTRDRRQVLFGLVHYAGRNPAVLDDGVTQQIALSPDGCRVAYSRQTGTATKDDPVLRRLRAIDLCTKAE